MRLRKVIPLTCQPSRAFADYMFKDYDGVLKVDDEVGNKKVHERAYLPLAEAAMAERVNLAAYDLRGSGKTSFVS